MNRTDSRSGTRTSRATQETGFPQFTRRTVLRNLCISRIVTQSLHDKVSPTVFSKRDKSHLDVLPWFSFLFAGVGLWHFDLGSCGNFCSTTAVPASDTPCLAPCSANSMVLTEWRKKSFSGMRLWTTALERCAFLSRSCCVVDTDVSLISSSHKGGFCVLVDSAADLFC